MRWWRAGFNCTDMFFPERKGEELKRLIWIQRIHQGLGTGVGWRACGTICFFFSSRRRHTRLQGDWSSDVCSSDLRPLSSGDAGEGEKVFAKCKICHQIGEGAKNAVGPELNGLIGRHSGTAPGYN